MTPLEECGLQHLSWELDEECTGCELVASPADCNGRGIIVDVTEDGVPYDLTRHRVYLIWRHRVTRRRGCIEMFVEAIRRYEDAAGEMLGLADELRKEAAAGGLSGPPGEPGIDGKQGPQGEPGPQGPAGFTPLVDIAIDAEGTTTLTVTDANGSKSATMLRGLRGEKGDRGEPGEVGPEGPMGPKGDRGEKGMTGKDGRTPQLARESTEKFSFDATGKATFKTKSRQYFVGDWIIDRYRNVAEVTQVIEESPGWRTIEMTLIGAFRGLGVAVCRGLDETVGTTAKGYIPVEGLFVREGDYVLSLDTGCIGVVVEEGPMVDGKSQLAQLKVVAKFGGSVTGDFATKDYVDKKFNSITDLGTKEF